ncbi:MAG: hypothetical protein C0501_13650 [Isosphaera sp.]|nr:hypothetical protein [Isosphaera sp.]
MSVFILDTDTLTLLQHDDPVVLAAVMSARRSGDTVGICVVTVEEQSSGWLAAARTARTPAQLARVSRLFARAAELWGTFRVFPQTEASLARFDALVRLKLNVGKMDLRVASVALDLGAVVVTHNTRDFGRVPGLPITDWTQPPTPAASA